MNVNLADAWRDCVDADRTREHFPIMRRTKDDNNQPACYCFTLSHWIWMQRATRWSTYSMSCLATTGGSRRAAHCDATQNGSDKTVHLVFDRLKFWPITFQVFGSLSRRHCRKQTTWHVWLTSMKAIDVWNKQTNKQEQQFAQPTNNLTHTRIKNLDFKTAGRFSRAALVMEPRRVLWDGSIPGTLNENF